MDYLKNVKPHLATGESEQIKKYYKIPLEKYKICIMLSQMNIDQLCLFACEKRENLIVFIEDIIIDYIKSRTKENDINEKYIQD